MSPSLPSPSCSWKDASIRPTKLHWSRISSKSNSFPFCRNQLLRGPILTVFRSNVGKTWELLHALVERSHWRNVALSFYIKMWLFLLLPIQDSSSFTPSTSSLPRHLEAEPHDGQAFAKWFYHRSPLNFQPLAHVRYSPAEENLLWDPGALCSAEAGTETVWQTPVDIALARWGEPYMKARSRLFLQGQSFSVFWLRYKHTGFIHLCWQVNSFALSSNHDFFWSPELKLRDDPGQYWHITHHSLSQTTEEEEEKKNQQKKSPATEQTPLTHATKALIFHAHPRTQIVLRLNTGSPQRTSEPVRVSQLPAGSE